MKKYTALFIALVLSSSALAGEGPGTRCETIDGQVITVNTETCPQHTEIRG